MKTIQLTITSILLFSSLFLGKTQTTVFTPNRSPVPTLIRTEMSKAELDTITAQCKRNHPNAIMINHATNMYNCHAYAWYMTGNEVCWIEDPTPFMTDGSYVEVADEEDAEIIYYDGAQDYHSAIKLSGSDMYISKWGPGPLMEHYPNDVLSINQGPQTYYRRFPLTPAITGSTLVCSGSTTTFTVSHRPMVFTWGCSSNLTHVSSPTNKTATFTANSSGSGAGWVSIIVNSSEKTRYNVWVGPPPAISQFLMDGPCFNYGYISNFASVCSGEQITLYPEFPGNVGTILGYEVSSTGCSAQVSSLTGQINFTGPTTIRATFSIDYRYKNSCGWSAWQTIYGSVRDCAAGENPFK